MSIVLPFHGTRGEAEAALDALAAIVLRDGDEVVVADNSGAGAVPERPGIRVVAADDQRSAYYARNVAGAVARNPWMLLVDGDCRPLPDVVDRYFDEPVPDDVGAVIGEIDGVPGQDGLVPRYARSRGHLTQEIHWQDAFRPFGVTANLLVRRAAWEDVGGFHEHIRSGGDIEFSWRLQEAGWKLAYRPQARVLHVHRSSVRALSRQAARYAAGRAWLRRRYPGSLSRPTLVPRLARCAAGVLVWTVRGEADRARFKALDAVYVASEYGAYLLSNTPPEAPGGPPPAAAVLVACEFPGREAPGAVAQARAAGGRVEAAKRPVRVDRAAERELSVAYAEDDGALRRAGAVVRLALTRPAAVARYVSRRRERGWPPLHDVAVAALRLRAMGAPALMAAPDEQAGRRTEALGELAS